MLLRGPATNDDYYNLYKILKCRLKTTMVVIVVCRKCSHYDLQFLETVRVELCSVNLCLMFILHRKF